MMRPREAGVMRLVIIANPASGGGRAYRAVRDHISRSVHPDWEIDLLPTRGPGHAGELAEQLLRHPPDLLGVCGGDGTLNEIASCVPHPPFPVALLPAGTANVVARELRLPLNPVRALEIALKRAERRVDLGELTGRGRRFVFVAGIGFDAYVAASVRPGLKKRIGMAAYAAAIVECLRSYSFPEFQVESEDRRFTAGSCLVCNARSYGGGLLFCPDAAMDDGLLDILVLEGKARLGLAGFLLKAWLGVAAKDRWITRFRTRTLRILGGPDVLVQIDGEPAGALPVEIAVRAATFPLVIPR